MSDAPQPEAGAPADALRAEVLEAVARYHDARHGRPGSAQQGGGSFRKEPFVAGVTPVPVNGRVFDAAEMVSLVDASLDFWLTAGPCARELESRLEGYVGVRYARLCNSGSSANLLAVSCLTSPRLRDRRLRPGDEVLTTAAGFPTTLNPILQNGLVPVFVDIDLGTYEANVQRLAEAVGPRTRAIVLAHTLGNPFDVAAVTAVAAEHDLVVVED
ncbi:MAG: DegT/DnrJ/EryC1/StrS family aminotransferase, partial [Acidimicrobiales bacterium]